MEPNRSARPGFSHEDPTRAVVHLWDGRSYEGEVSITAGLLHFAGERRVLMDGKITRRPAGARKWPLRAVREIRPLDALERAA
jgi:hypothetical protein